MSLLWFHAFVSVGMKAASVLARSTRMNVSTALMPAEASTPQNKGVYKETCVFLRLQTHGHSHGHAHSTVVSLFNTHASYWTKDRKSRRNLGEKSHLVIKCHFDSNGQGCFKFIIVWLKKNSKEGMPIQRCHHVTTSLHGKFFAFYAFGFLCVLCVVDLFSAVGGPRWSHITASVSQACPSMTLVAVTFIQLWSTTHRTQRTQNLVTFLKPLCYTKQYSLRISWPWPGGRYGK